jgi:ubiquinone/menaquinone biosynthesis C-methylase UbiE
MLTTAGRVRITRARWLKAQEYERRFWQRLSGEIAAGTEHELAWYKWRAAQLETLLGQITDPLPKPGAILEIGSGPIGIVNFLESGERVAIDPLEPFYRQQPDLVRLRNPGTNYLAGSGEELPLPDRSVSLVILDNVIDHTYSPGRILQEASRVLAPGGRLYVCVNVHTIWGAILHDVLARLRIDRGHPYTFTSGTFRRLLARHGFTIALERVEAYADVKAANRRSPHLTDRIKSCTGLSEFQHQALALRIADCGSRTEK